MKFEVCPRCEGKGVHDHPAFSNGISTEDFDADPDFEEAYWQGAYDVRCTECKGKRVVKVPDFDSLTQEEQEAWDDHCKVQEELFHEQQMRERGIEF